jgi:hypothetical protein
MKSSARKAMLLFSDKKQNLDFSDFRVSDSKINSTSASSGEIVGT